MESAYLLLGTNQGDRSHQLKKGCEKLSRAGVVKAISMIYKTEPWGFSDQPEFWNQAVHLQTELEPESLLEILKEIEMDCGRTTQVRWGPRELDIDILSFGTCIMKTEFLELPHPRMKERRFALIPFKEIAPEWLDPASGKTISQLLSECSDKLGVTPISY